MHDSTEVYLTGFELIRKDRKVKGRNGGGVCIYLRANLNTTNSSHFVHAMLSVCGFSCNEESMLIGT